MDQEKIGKFIANKRKEVGLTQKDLAEKLGVSDKAVSKWENARSMPDNSIMLPLCELLNISVNELLSGEKLSATDYSRKAEENMMNLIKENDEQKRYNKSSGLAIILWLIVLCVLMTLMLINTESGNAFLLLYYIDMPSFICILVIMLGSLICGRRLADFFCAFRYLRKEPEDKARIVHSIEAVGLAIKSLIVGGAFVTVFSMIYLLAQTDIYSKSLELFGKNVGVSMITLIYGLIGALILMPVKERLKKVYR